MTHDQREIHRKKRIIEYAERVGNVNKTCRYFGVARSTFYLWRERYRELGEEGLRSRRWGPHNHPNKTPDEVVEKILHLRRTYHMGPILRHGVAALDRHEAGDTAIGFCLPGERHSQIGESLLQSTIYIDSYEEGGLSGGVSANCQGRE